MKPLTIVCALLVFTGPVLAAGRQPAVDPAMWKAFAERLQVGETISVRFTDRGKLKGTFMGVEQDELLLHPRARVPELPIRIPFARIRSIEVTRAGEGMSAGKAALMGIGAGAAAFFTLLLLAFATLGD